MLEMKEGVRAKLMQDFMHLNAVIERPNKIRMFTRNMVEKTIVYSKCEESLDPVRSGRLIFTNDRILNAATKLNANEHSKICVINCGDRSIPGGGVTLGYPFTEESLCRSTNLYRSLSCTKVMTRFYGEGDPVYGTSSVVYSPKVIQIKTDDFNAEFLQHWFLLDVITIAAPSVKGIEYDELFLRSNLTEKLLLAFKVACRHSIDTVVLNDLNFQQRGYKESTIVKVLGSILKSYRKVFSNVVIAIYDYEDPGNLESFESLQDLIKKEIFDSD